jgi:tRNA(Ile)-lysidine synthase
MSELAPESLEGAVAASGLIEPGSGGVALLSGGPDSAGLAAGLAGFCGPDRVLGLHLNYRLRPDSDRDQSACARLCGELGLELAVERPELAGGNLQAAAREARYGAAERLRVRRGLDWIATGHTRTDLAETLLYRLATSPGRRALLGLPARRGAIVRPLLGVGRERVRELVERRGLPFRDDPSNAEPRFARNRVRNEVMPVLREIGPAVERVIAETRAELAEESEALELASAAALEAAGAGSGGIASAEALSDLHPAVRRLALRLLAERVVGRPVALGRERAEEVWRLAQAPEGGEVELGGGLAIQLEQGHIRVLAGPAAGPPPEAALELPGSCRFGGWEVRAELRAGPVAAGSADTAVLDPRALGGGLSVRAWREGDRMRPLGLGGTKSLQDLFTDQKVPRSLRRTLPVITAGGRIAWIAGVAVSEDFAAAPGAETAAVLSATVVGPTGVP